MKGFNFLTAGRVLLLAAAAVIAVGVSEAGAQTWDVGVGPDGLSSDNVKATLEGGTLTISGSGRMQNFVYVPFNFQAMTTEHYTTPWLTDNNHGPFAKVTSIVIEEGVTNIGQYTCYNCVNLTSVIIPSSVTTISEGAFSKCTKLTSVTIPGSVDTLNRAFDGCTGLTSVTVSNGVKVLTDFDGCTKLTTVTIPNTVTALGGFTNTGLTSITIPNSVTVIGDKYGYTNLGQGCTALTSVVIGNGVTKIPKDAFRGCTGLTSIIIPNSVDTIAGGAFDSCTALKSVAIPNSVKSLSGFDYSGLTSLTIPNSVISLSGFNYTRLTSLTIPNSVTSLNGFYGCSDLKSLVIGNGIKNFNALSISDYPKLDTIVVGNGITSIPKEAFKYNTALTYASIGNGAIGDNAFTGLGKLKTLILGDSVKSIGKEAFKSCSTLTSVTIPNNVDSIGYDAFLYCNALSFAAIGSGKIGNSAFSNLTNLTTLILGNNVKSIGEGAFYGCTRLTTLYVPDGVKSIGASAFKDCARLQTASIGNGVTSIGEWAFDGDAGLTSVILGNNVTSIAASAFKGCAGLTSLTSLASDPPGVNVDKNQGTFNGIDKTACKLKVQQVDMGMYRAANGWKDFANIEAVTFPNVSVLDITDVPTSFKVGEVLTLTGTVTPSTATNKTIAWSVAGASIAGTNFTGAVIDGGNKLSAAFPGTVVVRAAIANGAITGVDFERYFFITAEGVTSVQSRDRVIPSVKSTETAAVAPAARFSVEFAAGPNPAVKSSGGVVKFFRSGAVIKSASLRVYDASGNVVTAVAVSDNAAVGGNGKRSVGSWDLRDAKGRPVSEGTYLVRGVVKTKDGKSERVSLAVGVR